ncbi:hypothetical protein N665_0352s0019 [Sinapis alba]|nr:hypothetical protein N665_0352s0019 [Sinapis alba]
MVAKSSVEFDPYIERNAFNGTKEGVKGFVDAKITKSHVSSTFHLEIPTIDFASVHVDTSSREAVVEKVKYAAEKWEFFQLSRWKMEVLRSRNEFVYNSNFDLYTSSPSVNWKDDFSCYMAPHHPPPEELPVACREAMIEYSKHVMSLAEELGLKSETLKIMEYYLKTLLMICNHYPPCPQPY